MNANDIKKGTVVVLKEDTTTVNGRLAKGTSLVATGSPVGSGWFYGKVNNKGKKYQLKADWVKKG